MIPETVILRCIANCRNTSRYYASKGNRPLADWWDDRAKMFAHRRDQILGIPPSSTTTLNLGLSLMLSLATLRGEVLSTYNEMEPFLLGQNLPS